MPRRRHRKSVFPALTRRRIIIYLVTVGVMLVALATLPGLFSPYKLRGEFIDRKRGLGADWSVTATSNIVVTLFTKPPEYSNGFREIVEVTDTNPSETRIERIKSALGDTWYSATLTLARPDTSREWRFLVLRGSEGGGIGFRRFSPKWWLNEIVIHWDPAALRISQVEFHGDRYEDERQQLPSGE